MSLELTLTDGGLTALAAAITAGTDFTIDSVEVGMGQYTPTSSATALDTPFSPVRVFTDPAGFVDENRIAFNFEDNSSDAYDVGEIGVFSGTTLFAIGSQPSTDGFIFSKAADTDLLVSVHTVVSGVEDISAITFANTLLTNTNVDAGNIVSGTLDPDRLGGVPAGNLTGSIHVDRLPNIPAVKLPAATTTAKGAVERATDAEVATGTDTEKYVTPAQLNLALQSPTLERFTASGTWTKDTAATIVFVEVIGGGGGGGEGHQNDGWSGGRGSYVSNLYDASELSTTVTVTAGAGGQGETNGQSAEAGGESSFGTYITASGGSAEGGAESGGSHNGEPGRNGAAGRGNVAGGSGGHKGNGNSDDGGDGGDGDDGTGRGQTGGDGGGGGGGDDSGGDGGDGGIPGGGGGGGGYHDSGGHANNGDGGDGERGEVRVWTA